MGAASLAAGNPPAVPATVSSPSNRTAPTNGTSLPEAPGQQARVTVTRTDPRDAQQRQIMASIDDGTTTTLMFGERHTFEVQPGRHLLKVNNTLVWKRVPFVAAAGEHLEFQLVNRSGRLTLGFLALLGVAPLYLTIEGPRR